MSTSDFIANVRFDANGLVTALAQDDESREILMLAYMNEQTLRQTVETGIMTYWSRSRKKVWVKGESSGNTQVVKEIRLDCDGDAILFVVKQNGGAACHTGHKSCFYRKYEDGALVEEGEKVFEPESVYGSKE